MDYKEKVIAILNSKELSKEQKEKLEEIFPEPKESEGEKIRKEILAFINLKKSLGSMNQEQLDKSNSWIAWLEKQGEKGTNGNERETPNSAWSEEDELMLTSIIQTLKLTNGAVQMKIDWIKSLRPQSQWKPSEEQMRVLYLAIRCGINRGTTEETTLVSLFNDLKKLK